MRKALSRRDRARRLTRSGLLIVVLGGLCLAALVAGGVEPGRGEAARSREAVLRALRRLGPEASADRARVHAVLDRAEVTTALERRQLPWRRDPDAIFAAWAQAEETAIRAVIAQHERRLDRRQRWSTLEPEVARAVSEARRQARAPGLGERESAQAVQAELALDQARRLVGEGELEAALEALERALAHAGEVTIAWEALHDRFDSRESWVLWGGWVRETLETSQRSGEKALVVDKLRRRLYVIDRGRPVADYPVELGARGLRRKLHAGDRATPEGRYRVTEVRTGAATAYYKALMLDYPNAEDRRRYQEGRSRGLVPQGAGIGGLIEIHGRGGRGQDWTDGCIALTDEQVDQIMRHSRRGTPVTIVGTIPPGALDGESR